MNSIKIFSTYSYPCNDRESIVFGSNFRKGDFDEFIHYGGTYFCYAQKHVNKRIVYEWHS